MAHQELPQDFKEFLRLLTDHEVEYLERMRTAPGTDHFSGSTRLLLVFATRESMTEFLKVREQIDARSVELSDRDTIAVRCF